MPFIRVSGTSRYFDPETGETISRRRYEQLERPAQLEQREARYFERLEKRREMRAPIPREIRDNNKRYWLQRYSEQSAGRFNVEAKKRGDAIRITDTEARRRALVGGSEFNRLWARAELEGFEGGSGSAWDRIAFVAGARGGADDQHERSRYLAIIGWYTKQGNVGSQPWMRRRSDGRFTYPGLPRRVANRRGRSRAG